jgi:addiction module RelE/StbE family toxin
MANQPLRYHRVPEFDKQFSKLTKKNKSLKDRLINKIDQILNDPEIGEPKSYGLKGVRGVHIDPFVIVYMIVGDCIVFLYVAHHDEIYGKTKEIMQKDHTIELLKRINRLYPYL